MLAIDYVGRGTVSSAWIALPGWKRARIRVEAGLGGDLRVRVRGRASPVVTMGGPPPFALAELEPLQEELVVELEDTRALQLIADVTSGRGHRVQVSLEEVPADA